MAWALYQQNDTFIATIVSSLEAAAREREADEGLKITLNITDGRGSQATQNEQIDRFLSTGYDVICVNLVDRTAAAVIVDKAKSAGIPLIFFNREPVREDIMRWDKVYYVGAEAGKSGVMQGELVAEAYRADPEALDRSGDGVLQYVMLEGEPGHQDSLLRTEYSIKAVTSANVTTEKLANDTANWNRGQAASRMSQWIDQFGGGLRWSLPTTTTWRSAHWTPATRRGSSRSPLSSASTRLRPPVNRCARGAARQRL